MKAATILIFILTVFLGGCEERLAPESFRFEGISSEKSNWENKELYLKCSWYNPNNLSLTLKQTDVKIFIEGIEIGSLKAPGRVHFKKTQRNTFEALLSLKPSGLAVLAPVAALKQNQGYRLRLEGHCFVSGKKRDVSQEYFFEPSSDAFKGLLKILNSITVKS